MVFAPTTAFSGFEQVFGGGGGATAVITMLPETAPVVPPKPPIKMR